MATESASKTGHMPLGPRPPYNEFVDVDGSVRPHQRLLRKFLDATKPAALDAIAARLRQRIASQEVTFNILGVPGGSGRPWRLDVLPLIMERSRWERLAEALGQRARLLSAIYADVYSERKLMQRGLVPAQLILGNPHFIRSCCGFVPPGGHRLHLYACDVGVRSDGSFEAYADRADAPAGWGYALENRLALGSVLGDLFNGYGVERVRGFFAQVDACIRSVSVPLQGEQRVVVLSPGLGDESSFEHAYLTRYLGYDLVEGRDLTVRDRRVYLKTLSGLQRVTSVLRRVGASHCDPVALREDSTLGVAGLVSAAAAGNVALVNPLGVRVVEAAGLKPYLARICRELLGEELRLPSVPSYWCGDPESLAHSLSNLDSLVFKPAMLERQGPPIRPAKMSASEREQFLQRLKAAPGNFVAEEWLPLSTAPIFENRRLVDGPLAIRTFICRRDEEYQVMPGGLARADVPPDGFFLSLDETQHSTKDIWVPSSEVCDDRPPPAMPEGRVELRRGGIALPSRLLDDLFWLGRYIERADTIARLLRAGFERLGSEAPYESSQGLQRIVQTLASMEIFPRPADNAADADLEKALRTAVFSSTAATSLTGVLASIHGLTQRTRSRLSRDAWQLLHRLGNALEPAEGAKDPSVLAAALDDLLSLVAAIQGTIQDHMVRSHVWTFLDMGRQLERGISILYALKSMLAKGATRVHMEALLEVSDSLLTYRARYLSQLQVAPVVDLLLTDETNPRSALFQVQRLRDHVRELPNPDGTTRSAAQRRVISVEAGLLTLDVLKACSGDGNPLHEVLDKTLDQLWKLSNDVSNTWLSHTSPSRALAVPLWVDEELEAR